MAAPPLRIPLGLNMDEFDKQVENAKGITRTATKYILQQFIDMNTALGGPIMATAAAGIASSALRMVTAFTAVYTAGKLVGDAISATRDRLVEMVDVAERSAKVGLSPEFFQAFIEGAKGAEDRVKDLETALGRAFQATKPVLNPDWTVWDQGLAKVSAVEKAMREMRELFTTDQNYSGFDIFTNAKTQDDKIRGVLLYMQQLRAIGQDIAALDLGEKMFGAKFADDLRTGKETVDHMLQTITAGSNANFISNEAAKNAKELDDRLNDAYHTISERMKPSWDDLAEVALRIKATWTGIIEAIAQYKAAEKTGPVTIPGASDADARNNPDVNSAAFANPRILNAYRKRMGMAPDISPAAPSVPSEAAAWDAATKYNDYSGSAPAAESVPLPRRRPMDAPAPPAAQPVTEDALERAIDQANKRVAVMEAETRTIGMNSEARERAKVVAQLEEAAKRANTLAGKENTEVTEEQRAAIDQVADRMLNAARAAREQQTAYEGLQESLHFAGNELVNVLDAATQKGFSFRDTMASVLRDVQKQMLQAAITGEGAFAKMLGFSSSTGGVGGIMGLISGVFGGFRAAGGDVDGGTPYVVGEKGPELFVPGRSGTIVPNDMMRSHNGGGITVVINSSPVFQAGMTPTDMAAINAAMAQNNNLLRGQVVQDLRSSLGRDSQFLG